MRGEDGDRGVVSTYTAADGGAFGILHIPGGGSKQVVTPENIDSVDRHIYMNGRELYKRAVLAFGEAAEEALRRAGLRADEIDLMIPHQANRRIIASAAQRIGLPEEKILLNLDMVANTSAASIPIAIDHAVASGRLQADMMVLLAAFGAGLTWGSVVIRW
jgi:3-oxoacyl-[acyl-carrier-protein] synthase-3